MNQHIPTPEELRAAQRVHDEAAIGLMRQAQQHLRQATVLARQIERIERSGESDQRGESQ